MLLILNCDEWLSFGGIVRFSTIRGEIKILEVEVHYFLYNVALNVTNHPITALYSHHVTQTNQSDHSNHTT